MTSEEYIQLLNDLSAELVTSLSDDNPDLNARAILLLEKAGQIGSDEELSAIEETGFVFRFLQDYLDTYRPDDDSSEYLPHFNVMLNQLTLFVMYYYIEAHVELKGKMVTIPNDILNSIYEADNTETLH